jgi:hypothetical protein
LAIALVSLPVAAQTLYDNGPINGTTDAWTINFGFAVSNTFSLSAQSQLTGLNFGAWVFPGDLLQTAEVEIGTEEFSNNLFDQVVSFTQSNCSGNQYGFNVCDEQGAFSGSGVSLGTGTYWLTLINASVNTGDPIYWDENSGRSMASESSVGTIPSEAFTILGMGGSTTMTYFYPKPNMVLLMASGILGFVGVARRRLF